jgi:hypothetical protein
LEIVLLKYVVNRASNIKIKLYDIIGNLISIENYDANIGENEFNINTVKLTQGVYIYSIEISDRMITSDKFIVY